MLKSFDEMRQIMYNCGEIPSFEYGIATDEEIQIVWKKNGGLYAVKF